MAAFRTPISKILQPHLELRAATIYSGTGPLTILASPLSEVAYQLADTNSGDRTVIAKVLLVYWLHPPN
jgi:hypothetical protein